MKKILALFIVLVLVLSLAACGQSSQPDETTLPATEPATEPPLTAADVFNNLSANMETAEATRLYMDVSFDLRYTQGEDAATEAISYSMGADIRVNSEPFGSYTLSSIAIDTTGFYFGYDIEVYMVEEEGSVVMYMQFFDTWERTDTGMTVQEYINSDEMTDVSSDSIWNGSAMPADLALDEATQDLNGTEVYVLRCSIAAEEMSDAFSNAGLDTEGYTDDLSIPVIYYVDAQNFTLLRMEMDTAFLEEYLCEMLAEAVLGTVTEDMTIEIQVSNFVYELGYGSQEIPEVPQEAFDYIENNPWIDYETENQESGPLVLDCGSEQLLLTVPDGWTGESFLSDNVWVYNEDFSLLGDYYYLEGSTRDDLLSMVQSDVDAFQEGDLYVSHGEGPAIEGYETMVVIGDGMSAYYAWREAGDGWLLIYVFDYTGTDDATDLLPQFVDLMSPYAG